MRSTRMIGLGAGAVVLAGSFAVPALTGSAAAGGNEAFTVYSVGANETSVDVGQHGYGAGDMDVHVARLARNGKTVGWDTGSCLTTAVSPRLATQICHIVLNLQGGQLVTDGAVQDGPKGPGTFHLAITGGTGRYRTASGEIAVTASDGPVRIDVAIVR